MNGGSDGDIKVRINKAQVVFNLLKKVCGIRVSSSAKQSSEFSIPMCMKSVLLYVSETWRIATLKISRTDRVTNEDLWKQASKEAIQIKFRRRKWRWIGHTLRKHPDSVTRQALKWKSQGKRKRGRPKNTRKRDVDVETKSWSHTWNSLERLAQDRMRWRKEIVDGLCSRRS